MRNLTFQAGHYCHICNRGTDKRLIFNDSYDYLRFLESMREFNQVKPIGSIYQKKRISRIDVQALRPLDAGKINQKNSQNFLKSVNYNSQAVGALNGLVEIIAYCLNSNHYHFLLKQLKENGISKFIQKLAGGYTCYFNNKYDRSGALFQGKFKAAEIKSEEQLLYVSSYINGNPEIHKIAKARDWAYSSYPDFLGKRQGTLNKKEIILKEFKNINEYKKFTDGVIKNSSKFKEELKKIQIE